MLGLKLEGKDVTFSLERLLSSGIINGNPSKKIATVDLFNEDPDIDAVKVLLGFLRNYPSTKQRPGLYWVKVCSMYSSTDPRDETYKEGMDHSIALGTEF